MNSDDMDKEQNGYKAGRNPLMGEFCRKFDFEPVPYGSSHNKSSSKREAFTKKVTDQLSDIKYFYFGEVKVEWTLYFDEQKRLEKSDIGDLDNYAKLLCDSIKGPKGILIDDTQIQTLNIAWIDTGDNPYFELKILGNPDDFIMKPIVLYEMPDSLYYPFSTRQWSPEGITDCSQEQFRLLLSALYRSIKNKHDFRISLQKNGYSPIEAYRTSRCLKPILYGFHKTRVSDAGYILRSISEWTSEFSVDDVLNDMHAKG